MNHSFLRPLALSAALSFALMGTAGAAPYTTLNTDASSVAFGYTQMGVNMKGGFNDIRASQFSFDPANPEDANVVIEIPLSSIDAGYADANDELEKAEWLDMASHPVARFESTSVKAVGDNEYAVTGDLTIKGQTHDVTVPFTFKEDGDAGIFEGSLTFERAAFGIGQGMWGDVNIVANEIRIDFNIVANQ